MVKRILCTFATQLQKPHEISFFRFFFVFLGTQLHAQQYAIQIEVRDETNNELILGAKVHSIDEDKIAVFTKGAGRFTSNLRYHHMHIYAYWF